MAAPASLTALPIELLIHFVAPYLTTPDLGALRLVSRGIERALFDTFAREFFTKRQFMLTTPSLTAMIDISRHPEFSKSVKHLIIGSESFSTRAMNNPTTFHNPFAGTGEQHREAYARAHADQRALMCTGQHIPLLTEALRNFPNLQTIGMRDYSAHGRNRDEGSRWRSYGSATVEIETRVSFQYGHEGGESDFPTRVFASLLYATLKAGVSIPTIEVIIRHHPSGVEDFGFHLPVSPLASEDTTNTLFSGLRTLLLTLGTEQLTQPNVLQFLARCQELTHLRLNFKEARTRSWHGVSALLDTIAGPGDPTLPCLQTLDIGMCSVTPEALLAVISKYAATLQSVTLWKITLMFMMPRHADETGKANPWKFLFGRLLHSKSIKLTKMAMGYLAQRSQDLDHVSHVSVYLQSKFEKKDWKPLECKGDKATIIPYLMDQLRPQYVELSQSSHSGEDENEDEDEEEPNEDEDDEMDDGEE